MAMALTSGAAQVRAVDEKELGNRAFGAKEFSQAIVHFTKCIELDPTCGPCAAASSLHTKRVDRRCLSSFLHSSA